MDSACLEMGGKVDLKLWVKPGCVLATSVRQGKWFSVAIGPVSKGHSVVPRAVLWDLDFFFLNFVEDRP